MLSLSQFTLTFFIIITHQGCDSFLLAIGDNLRKLKKNNYITEKGKKILKVKLFRSMTRKMLFKSVHVII